MAAISVVVPTYNGAALLPECLGALAAQDLTPDEILVVDDGSNDGTPALLRDCYPHVRGIVLPKNRGFAAAVNAGIRAASAPLIALLNNDARPDPGWLAALARAAEARLEIDVFASRMVTAEEPARIDSIGLALTHGFGQVSPSAGIADGPEFAVEREVFGACAGAALYRRRCFDAIGLFDEGLRILWEDVDVALRARVAGLRTLAVGAARVRHLGSATIGRASFRGAYHYCRNRIPVVLKSAPLPLLLAEAGAAALATARIAALYARRGQALAALAGTVAGCARGAAALLRRGSVPRAGDAARRLAADLDAGSAERARQRQTRGAP